MHPMCTRSFWGVLPGSTSVSILDQSTQRRQLCEARRICWRVLLGSPSVSRRPRLPYEVPGEYSLATLLGSTPVAGALLNSTSMAGEYSSAS